jgi:hypothetical protein
MGGSRRFGAIEIAFAKMKRNLIECALFPLFGLRQPEHPALGVVGRALPANGFLISNLYELVHELHSSGVKPTSRRILAESEPESPDLLCGLRQYSCRCEARWNHVAAQHIYDSRANLRSRYAVRLSHPCRANNARRG